MTESSISIPGLEHALSGIRHETRKGQVVSVTGMVIRAAVPDVRVGDVCQIQRPPDPPLNAEVVGFSQDHILLMPLGPLEGVQVRARIVPSGTSLRVPCGDQVMGRVVDALGQPIDDGRPLDNSTSHPLITRPPNPLHRQPIAQPVHTGIRAIDGLLTVGRGQRVGIFAAAGVGKSTLLAALARHVRADRVVLALIGERGREVLPFLENDLGKEGMQRATVVVSTADEPALRRLKAAYTATAIAESERAKGRNVVLMMDSVTRFARALRDVGLASGEAPGRQGYPASVFAALPQLFERAGNDGAGSITAFYTVLVSGDDLTEPIADETMSLLDGHIILSRTLADREHWPAIDVQKSRSRVANSLISNEHRAAAGWARQVLATYHQNYDKISLGLYEAPSAREGRLVASIDQVNQFLQQPLDVAVDYDGAIADLRQRAADAGIA